MTGVGEYAPVSPMGDFRPDPRPLPLQSTGLCTRTHARRPRPAFRRAMAGQALTVVLVALLVTVCLIGLWATYALRSAYDREAQHRTRAEVQLTAHRLAARFTAGQSITEPLTPDWLPSGLTMAVGIYDHLGQRCTVVTNDLTGELTLPDNLDVAGADREESRYVHGVWALTVPLRKADGERLGHLRLLARHRQAQPRPGCPTAGVPLPVCRPARTPSGFAAGTTWVRCRK
jgi:hypothetical protein